MIIVDENFPVRQRLILTSAGIHARHIGYDIGRPSMADDLVVSLLHQLRRPTLFTFDIDYSRVKLCHRAYCLVFLDVPSGQGAFFVRRVLRHPLFNTQAKRMGTVLRVSPTGIRVWRLNAEHEEEIAW
jgi:hypothetical protein